MAKIEILDPIAEAPLGEARLAPRPVSLHGKRVGFRIDPAWRSFYVFADAVEAELRSRFSLPSVTRFEPGSRAGEASEETSRRLREFAAAVDVAIVGLAT